MSAPHDERMVWTLNSVALPLNIQIVADARGVYWCVANGNRNMGLATPLWFWEYSDVSNTNR